MATLIAHGMIIDNDSVLLIKRSKIKRGKPNYNALRWDIPGGTVEPKESPRQAAMREIKEEVNCDAEVKKIIFDSYEYDTEKEQGFVTLVYHVNLVDSKNIRLDPEEHSEYRWVNISNIIDRNIELDLLEYVYPALERIVEVYTV
jgi:8-oxo-dGTP diphosphatase